MQLGVLVILNIVNTEGAKLRVCILNLPVHFYQLAQVCDVALKLELVNYQ